MKETFKIILVVILIALVVFLIGVVFAVTDKNYEQTSADCLEFSLDRFRGYVCEFDDNINCYIFPGYGVSCVEVSNGEEIP